MEVYKRIFFFVTHPAITQQTFRQRMVGKRSPYSLQLLDFAYMPN